MIVEPDFLDHWKTRLLVDLLGGDEMAPLYVIRLWSHCQNRRKSRLENVSSKALKAICRFAGDADSLESSMIESGFLARESTDLIATGWDEYNSKLVANWGNGGNGGRPKKPSGNPTETQTKPNKNPTLTQQKPNANPTETQSGVGVTDKIRLEKSREEKSNYTHTHSEKEIEAKVDKTLDQVGQFPTAIADAECRRKLRTWIVIRFLKNHGDMLHAEQIRSLFSKNNHWSRERWIKSIEMSIEKGSKNFCDATNDFQERLPYQSSKTPKQRVRLPENEDEGLVGVNTK